MPEYNLPAPIRAMPYARVGQGGAKLLVSICAGDLSGQADDRGIPKPLDDTVTWFRERRDRKQT